jgi:hypothetical protein
MCSFIFGYGVSALNIAKERIEIIKYNTKIIESISEVAVAQTCASDLLMRVNHYMDGHIKGENLCPECAGIGHEFDIDRIDVEDKMVELPNTYNQVVLDLNEIKLSVNNLLFGSLHQVQKLKYILKSQREQHAINKNELRANINN